MIETAKGRGLELNPGHKDAAEVLLRWFRSVVPNLRAGPLIRLTRQIRGGLDTINGVLLLFFVKYWVI